MREGVCQATFGVQCQSKIKFRWVYLRFRSVSSNLCSAMGGGKLGVGVVLYIGCSIRRQSLVEECCFRKKIARHHDLRIIREAILEVLKVEILPEWRIHIEDTHSKTQIHTDTYTHIHTHTHIHRNTPTRGTYTKNTDTHRDTDT
jgi:hypothetical protein